MYEIHLESRDEIWIGIIIVILALFIFLQEPFDRWNNRNVPLRCSLANEQCKLEIYSKNYGKTLLPVRIYDIRHIYIRDGVEVTLGDCDLLKEVCIRNTEPPLVCIWIDKESTCECMVMPEKSNTAKI